MKHVLAIMVSIAALCVRAGLSNDLARVVEIYNSTETGRVQLHGERTGLVYATNEPPPTVTATYADGYTITETLPVKQPTVANPEARPNMGVPPALAAIIEARKAALARTNSVTVVSAPGSGPVPPARPVTLSKAKIAAAVDQMGLTTSFFNWINSKAVYATAWYATGATIVYDPAANGGDLAALVTALQIPTNQVPQLIQGCAP